MEQNRAGEVRRIMSQLRHDAQRIARRFDLSFSDLRTERRGAGHYGICYEDGRIKVRVLHARRGVPLKYSGLINTLCHELAHLRHFDHGEEFKAFYFQMLEWSRAEGIYRPGRPRQPSARDPQGSEVVPEVVPATPEEAQEYIAQIISQLEGKAKPAPTRTRPTPAHPLQLELFPPSGQE